MFLWCCNLQAEAAENLRMKFPHTLRTYPFTSTRLRHIRHVSFIYAFGKIWAFLDGLPDRHEKGVCELLSVALSDQKHRKWTCMLDGGTRRGSSSTQPDTAGWTRGFRLYSTLVAVHVLLVGPRAIRLASRRLQAVSHFYKEDNEFIISFFLI